MIMEISSTGVAKWNRITDLTRRTPLTVMKIMNRSMMTSDRSMMYFIQLLGRKMSAISMVMCSRLPVTWLMDR